MFTSYNYFFKLIWKHFFVLLYSVRKTSCAFKLFFIYLKPEFFMHFIWVIELNMTELINKIVILDFETITLSYINTVYPHFQR